MKCPRLSYRSSFIVMFILTLSLFACKIVIGYVSNSVALIADSFHMLSDLAVLCVGYAALRFSKRRKLDEINESAYTFGRVRAEILGGLINAIFLVAFCFSISIEALKRFIMTEMIERPFPVLLVGLASLVVNVVGLIMFYQRSKAKSRLKCGWGNSLSSEQTKSPEQTNTTEDEQLQTEDEQLQSMISEKRKDSVTPIPSTLDWTGEVSHPHEMNKQGVYLHILEHALSSTIIIISALVVMFVNEKWTAYVDPAITIIVVIIILYSVFPLMKEAILIFMQSVPANLKIQDLELRLMTDIPAVLGVHEFHVWQLAGHQVIGSAHILLESTTDVKVVCKRVEEFFREEGIYHITLQPEFRSVSPETISEGKDECMLECAEKDICKDHTCCIKDTVPIIQAENI